MLEGKAGVKRFLAGQRRPRAPASSSERLSYSALWAAAERRRAEQRWQSRHRWESTGPRRRQHSLSRQAGPAGPSRQSPGAASRHPCPRGCARPAPGRGGAADVAARPPSRRVLCGAGASRAAARGGAGRGPSRAGQGTALLSPSRGGVAGGCKGRELGGGEEEGPAWGSPRRAPRLRSVPQGHPRSMAGRGAGSGLQSPAVAQPLAGGHLYPFVSAESEGPEEEGEVSELRPRGREKVRRSASRDRLDDIVLLTKDIREGDTLNAIALQFCCSVGARAAQGRAGPAARGGSAWETPRSQKWKMMSDCSCYGV